MNRKHNKMNMGLVFFVVALFVVSSGMVAIGKVLTSDVGKENNNDELTTLSLIEPLDCGYLIVDGLPGHYPNVDYNATAYNHYNIDLGAEEAEVTLTVSYYLNPDGDYDKAYTYFACNGQYNYFNTLINEDKIWEDDLEITLDLQHDTTYEFGLSVLWTDWWDTREVGDTMGEGGPRVATGTITTKKADEPGEPMGCAVIVEAGFGDALQGSFHTSAAYAKSTFEGLGYVEGQNLKCFNRPTKSILKDFIKNDLPNWLDSDRNDNIFFYIVDHGVGKHLQDVIDYIPTNEGKVVLNNNKELLSSIELGNWLKTISTRYAFGIFVIEACFAGEWIANAGWLATQTDHIIITATDEDHVSYGWTKGQAVFSKPFFTALQDGQTSYGKAWEYADEAVYNTMKDLRENSKIRNLVKSISNDYSGSISNYLFLLNKLLRLSKQDIFSKLFTAARPEKDIEPLYIDANDMMKMWEEYRNYLLQSPQLSDNGKSYDRAGTKGRNVVDTCSNEWGEDGDLALGVYPSKPG